MSLFSLVEHLPAMAGRKSAPLGASAASVERIFAVLSWHGSAPALRGSGPKLWHAGNFSQRRFYQSKTGVYGYRPKVERHFEIPREVLESRTKESNFHRLVSAYRKYGHKKADVDPVNFNHARVVPELDLGRYGLREDETLTFAGILAARGPSGTAREIVQFLENTYCGKMSAEFEHLEEEREREWFAERMEKLSSENLDADSRVSLATELLKSQTFDRFLATKFVTLKRYGGEGAESMLGAIMEVLKVAAEDGVEHVVVGMPHRGRFNLVTGLLQFPPVRMFRKFRGLSELPPDARASGDVSNHFSVSVDVDVAGKKVHVIVLNNPSHLEAVNPVSVGKTRARQQSVGDGDYSSAPATRWSSKVLNLQIHGDAALTGQGINQELLQLSAVPHFEVGGSIHVVVNNQLGFTTPADRGRSSRYASDVGKMVAAPVVHVNGNFPELVVKAARVAAQYQREFRKDVFVDLNCYRKWGHNELDDPTFTNPTLYKIIHSQKTVPDMYAEELVAAGVLTETDVGDIVGKHAAFLNDELRRIDTYTPEATYFLKKWSGISQAPSAVTSWDTGCDVQLLRYIGSRSVTFPPHFTIHPHLDKTHVKPRLAKLAQETNIDWSTAEALAFGSLLYQGYNVRLSGQDVGRGTFSHRHVMLVDQETNDTYVPLNSLAEDQAGHLEVANSILSEEAVLAFEYGMSIESPRSLVVWEAQFGDFFNGAQIIIDTFVVSGESKWLVCSGLVVLLPHGYDGAGPEHSSCRLERFLQLSDSSEVLPDGECVNVHVVNPTTPAQYFHLLRGQVLKNYRKPLVVVAPKTLLRLPEAVSSLSDFAPGTSFSPVIGDVEATAEKVRKVIFVSGKHYFALQKHREERQLSDVAVVRVEALSPFPTLQLQQEVAKYTRATTFIWSQEEHQNMGAWTFVKNRFENLVGRKVRYAGRGPLATPAVGVGQVHLREAEEVTAKPFSM